MKKAQNGVKTPTDKEKTDAAIKAQKAKRDGMYSAEEARRAKNSEANRRARLPLAEQKRLRDATKVTKAPAKGSDITKYMNVGAPKKATPIKRKATPVKKALDRSSVAAPTKASASRRMPSGMSKPSVPGVSAKPAAKQYSESERKTIAAMNNGKKADGTMKESAQRKIASIRAKERSATNKAGRVAKRTAIRAIRRGK